MIELGVLFLRRILFVLFVTLLFSCGGGGGGGTTSIPTVVSKSVVVLPTDGSVMTTIDANGMMNLTGAVPNLASGSVIIDPRGTGLLRKVQSVNKSREGTTVQTTQGTLEDVFESGIVKDKRTIGIGDVESFTPGGPGIQLKGGKSRLVSGRIELELGGFKLEDDSGASLSVSGSISLGISFDTEINIERFKVKDAKFVCTVDGDASATLKGSLSKTLFEKKTLLGTIVGTPFVVTAGPVPLVFSPTIGLYAKTSGTVKSGFEVTASAGFTAELGAKYSDQSWTLIKGFEVNSNVCQPKPNVYSSFTFAFTPARADCSLKLYGLVGPYLFVNAPEYTATLKRSTNPAGLGITADRIYEGGIGVKVEALGTSLLSYESEATLSATLTLLDKFFPDDAGVGVEIK